MKNIYIYIYIYKEKKREKGGKPKYYLPFNKNVYRMSMGDVLHNDSPKEFQVPVVWKLFTTTLSHWKWDLNTQDLISEQKYEIERAAPTQSK